MDVNTTPTKGRIQKSKQSYTSRIYQISFFILLYNIPMSKSSDSMSSDLNHLKESSSSQRLYNRTISTESSNSDKISDMTELMNRLSTFRTWPDDVVISAAELTNCGLYYTGFGDEVRCFECDVPIRDWKDDDVPYQRHLTESPGCNYLALKKFKDKHGQHSANNIINNHIDDETITNEETERFVLPEDTYNINSRTETPELTHIRSNTDALNVITNNNPHASTEENTWYTPRVEETSEQILPENVDYTIEANRLASFIGHWSADAPITPEEITHAGCYYTGPNDRVQCAWCRGGMYNWERGDTAFGEHSRHFPNCPFVKDKINQLLYPTVNTPTENKHQAKVTKSNDINDLPAVRIVRDMGYEMDIIKKAVKKINRKSEEKITSAKLLDIIFEIEISEDIDTDSSLEGATGGGEESNTNNDQTSLFETKTNNTDTVTNQQVNHNTNNPGTSLFETTNNTDIVTNEQSELTRLLEENDTLKGKTMCKVCLDSEVNVLFLPCRHLVCCETCSDAVRECPMCRTAIIGTVKTYL